MFVIYELLSGWPDVLVMNYYRTSSKRKIVRFGVNGKEFLVGMIRCG